MHFDHWPNLSQSNYIWYIFFFNFSLNKKSICKKQNIFGDMAILELVKCKLYNFTPKNISTIQTQTYLWVITEYFIELIFSQHWFSGTYEIFTFLGGLLHFTSQKQTATSCDLVDKFKHSIGHEVIATVALSLEFTINIYIISLLSVNAQNRNVRTMVFNL